MTPLTRRDLLRSGIAVSASSLLPVSSLRTASQAVGEAYKSPLPENSRAIAPREHLLLNFDWKFFQGNAADPARDLEAPAQACEQSLQLGLGFLIAQILVGDVLRFLIGELA